jgi:nitroreductase
MPFKSIARLGKNKKEADIPEEYIEEKEVDVSELIFSTIKNRRSVRNYQKRNVDNKLIMRILESARFAPSSGNYQPWEFIVVRNPKIKEHLVEACYNQKWMMDASVFIVACTNMRLAGAIYGQRGLRLYGTQAVAAAVENMILTAEALGLSTCWVGAFSEIMVSRILDCPEYVRPSAIITVGYAVRKPLAPARHPIENFVHLEKFGETLQMKQLKKEQKPTYMKFKG